jgi:catechol 2,3-dioxygenase-like lactoylglutathione lyase family enzyme
MSNVAPGGSTAEETSLPGSLDLGAFSISLTVADLERSRAFYAALGFEVTGGDPEHDYLILKNGESTIGLFSGMFDKNILTFNPGLTNRMERLDEFTDVREIQAALEAQGVEIVQRVEEGSTGAGSLTVVDPDGNPILVDQFF